MYWSYIEEVRKMLKAVIINNLISIAIYVCMCIVLILPIGNTWFYGMWRDNMKSNEIVYNWAMIGVFTIVSLFLFFWLGRKFLNDTGNTLLSISSVIMVPILVSIASFVAFSNLDSRLGIAGFLGTPIYPVSETMSYFLRMDLKYAYMAMSILPPLTMWIGMIGKRLV